MYEPTEEQIALCEDWIRLFARPRKTINRRAYSYVLKHRVEAWLREQGRSAYIPQAAFVTAAERLGFAVKRTASWSGYPDSAFLAMGFPRATN